MKITNLYYLVESKSSFLKTMHFKAIQTDENVTIEEVKYSYKYLESLKKIADELYEQGIHVVSDGVDVRNNEYNISILTNDYRSLSENGYLEKILSDLPINFEEHEGANATSSLWGGDRIFNHDRGSRLSIGIGGTYNGQGAIVTAGYGNENSPYISNFEHQIGQVAYQQANTAPLNNGETALGDFAIVPLDSDTATNRVHPAGLQITGIYSSLPVGSMVYKYGVTTGYSWGIVERTNIRLTYGIYTVSGLYQMNMTNDSGANAVDEGDSGGPVWRKNGSANQLHGIVTADINGESPKKTVYTTPIPYVEHWGFKTKTN